MTIDRFTTRSVAPAVSGDHKTNMCGTCGEDNERREGSPVQLVSVDTSGHDVTTSMRAWQTVDSGFALTAVVCAYTMDRWPSILAAIASLEAQASPPAEIILVIDHNHEMYVAARGQFATNTMVTVLENSEARGLSGARNTGITAALGDVIAFLDDDARIAQKTWASQLLNHFDDPDVQVVGGSAVPDWAGRVAEWLPPEFYWVIGCSFIGQPSEVTTVRNVLGCNMAIRRTALETVGHFDKCVGRGRGRLPMGNEETDFCIRVNDQIRSARVVYDPHLVVQHQVTGERTTFGYFARRCYAEGLSKARLASLAGRQAALSTERNYTRRTLPLGVLREARQVLVGGDGHSRATAARRIAAIVSGFVMTVAGYLKGRAGTISLRRHR